MATFRIKCSFAVKPWIRWISFAAASACFAWGGIEWAQQYRFQAQARAEFEQLDRPITHQVVQPALLKQAPPPTLTRLEIPRLNVSGFIENGFDSRTLGRAIGRSPRGAKPGGPGNLVLAAHRDTFFAGLENVKLGDEVDVQSAGGPVLRYEVSKILVVGRSDNWVMNSTPNENLVTLITCYPFHFVGNAPNRLVVQAVPIKPILARDL